MNVDQHLQRAEVALRTTYGLFFVVAGADKFFNFVTPWIKYVSPFIESFFNTPFHKLMYGIGIFEIALGILVFTRPKFGAYLAMLWMLIIVVNLVSMGHFYDIAVRDLVIAVGAFALAQLSSCKESKLH